MIGGYKIMDFKDVNIVSTSGGASTTTVTIEGIYEAFESNYCKMPVIHGLIIDDVEYWDFSAAVSTTDGVFTFVLEHNNIDYYVIKVLPDDKVTAVKYTN